MGPDSICTQKYQKKPLMVFALAFTWSW
uniref:Uncharacterized protein n=1 Tax=Arundo donax TaxID=35708 RepID=A0A0A8ZP53_ARUDO